MTQPIDTVRERTISGLGSKLTSRDTPPIWWWVIQLTALALHLPLSLLTGSQSALASKQSVLLIGTSVALASIALYLLLSWLVLPKWKALALVSVTVLYFWHWSGGEGIGPLTGSLVATGIYALVAVAAVKYADRQLFKMAAFVVSVTLAGTLGLMAISDWLRAPERTVGVQNPIDVVEFVERPDIVLIVLDGYGRSDVISEVFGYDNEPFLDHLRSQGFDVAERSVANYSITHLSIPALLNMSYMHPEEALIGNNDLNYLADEISGGSAFVSHMKANGYTYIHGESDHWYNVCGNEVDVCLPGPNPDITGHAMLIKTPVGGFFYRDTADPTTALNRERVAQLINWDQTTRGWPSGPRFVFLHLQLPHPPLYMDSNCAVRLDPELGGRIMNNGEMSQAQLEVRKQAWIEQVQCANSTIEDFLSQVDESTLVALVSDHGPDLRFRLRPNPAELDESGLKERFPNLTAVRFPEGCRGTLPDDVDTVNLFRTVISCLSGEPIDSLETRYFVAGFGGPIVELKLDLQTAED
jgi:hypothetical protein